MPVLPSYGSIARLHFGFWPTLVCVRVGLHKPCCSLENGRLQFLRAFGNKLDNKKEDNRI